MIREITIAERMFKSITKPDAFKTSDGHVVIEIPLRERVKTMSVRIPEEALISIDKTVVVTQMKTTEKITRSELIKRVVEALAFAFETMNYDVDTIKITCGNKEKEYTIAIRLSSVR